MPREHGLVLPFFLWGMGEAHKIYWLHWDKVCSDREFGELKIMRIKEFNLVSL